MKNDALAGPRDVGKQAVFDGVVLGSVRWVVRDTDIQAQSTGKFLQRLLEDRKHAANPSRLCESDQVAEGASQRCGSNSASRELGQVGNLVSTSFR